MQILNNVFNKKTINVMLDLETTGFRPGCRVLSIGLAHFDHSGPLKSTTILPAIELQNGHDDDSTMEWWSKQSPEARQVFADNIAEGIEPKDAANKMREFIRECIDYHCQSVDTDPSDVRVALWGNSSTFDNSILAVMFENNGVSKLPWNTFGDRCYRTVINMLDKAEVARLGTHHNCEDDARHQAEVLVATLHNASN